MGKIRRSGYVFVWFLGDHSPPHIHIFKDGKLLCKWRLDHQTELSGKANRRIRELIRELDDEGYFQELRRRFNEN